MEEKINLLLNKAIQKYLELAKCARNAQAVGKSSAEEFCLLTRLHAVIHVLQNTPELLDYDRFRELEKIVNQIGGRDEIPYRPIVQTPVLAPPAKDCCDQIDDIRNELEELRDLLNYIPPTLSLQSIDFAPGKYEVGYGLVQSDIRWNANKKPLTVISIDLPNDMDVNTINLTGIIPDVTIDLRAFVPVLKRIYGFYHDKQAFRGQHLIAEDALEFRSVWPCYWGKGPATLLDNPATRNNLIHGLTRELDCPKCIEANLTDGEYLWYLFPYTGTAKQFWTENGAISGSWKGTFDNFQTQSMVANGASGGAEYGVIRFDEHGIGFVKVCIKEMLYPEVIIEEPVIILPEPEPEPEIPVVTAYESIWSEVQCVQINQ